MRSTGALSGRERQAVGRQLLNPDRLEARAPVEQVLARRRVVEGHRVDIFEAGAEEQRHAHVDERARRAVGRGDRERMAALVMVAGVGRRRIIHEVGRAIEDHAWRPEVLRGGRPIRFLGKRVAEIFPGDEIGRAGDLDVDPRVVVQGLRRVSVIKTVRREDHRGVGKIAVKDRVEVEAVGSLGGADGPVREGLRRREVITHPAVLCARYRTTLVSAFDPLRTLGFVGMLVCCSQEVLGQRVIDAFSTNQS